MAKLTYSAIASADGYVEDAAGAFDWAAPDDDLLCFINDLERPVGTYLYGRRMYETMVYWETAHAVPDQSAAALDFTGIWRAAEKIVFSKTMETESSTRTRIERDFDPDVVRQLKSATERSLLASARIWTSWTRGGSRVVRFTFGTASSQPERRLQLSRARWRVMSAA